MIMYMIGFAILLYALFEHRDIIRVEWNKVGSFLGFLAFITCLRITSFDIAMRFDIFELMPFYPSIALKDGMWQFMMVWWEDMFFVFPMFLIIKSLPKTVAGVIVAFISMEFGAGHLDQGLWWAMLTSFYPFFISYLFGKKYGLGTVMICHILYDFVTILTSIAGSSWIF